ncbi:putative thioredoxin [Candidatus Saccharimonas aalborgensis]|uniref:Thioredoxin n=1 Tax=Candidatus Saccharimonas aalborgensis TaxID=1332188 RepID=R4PUV4_9BACT|nr:thioredoxin [Candidatus Saccharimonas aalborgensis]AGL61950.1 putative thioredoxin [Candidatus Saccharimonas aalborgensis]QQS68481.1 MAG: thioredoxin [Candidatus Saccharibacteria bacterium]QQS70772.1 MAG: thioredoxin [Candidatus Saccharibacteria bacterium]
MALYSTTTNQEFDDKVLKSKKIVLVDFWATWCPPCRVMAPILEDVAKKMDDVLDVIKIDVEASADNSQLASKYGVRGIPNMQVFKGGKVVKELVGARPANVLESELKSVTS